MATKQSSRPRSTTTSRTKAAPRPPVLRTAFEGHVLDAWGLILLTLGLVAGLGTYLDIAGPAGTTIDTGAGALVGLLRYVLPVALAVAGIALVRQQVATEDRGAAVRVAVGAALVLVGVTGLLHVWVDAPDDVTGVDALIDSGGFLGAATGAPLEAVAWVWGATLVLATITVLGLVVITHIPVRTVLAAVVSALRFVVRGAGTGIGALMRAPGERADGSTQLDGDDHPGGPGSEGESPTMVVGGHAIDLTTSEA
ncbi:MAG: DNA translocase FtsK 4TM domain-containing protein, partial [Acidimicrobiales bacterium]